MALTILVAFVSSCAPAPVRPAGPARGGASLPLSGSYEAKFSAPYVGTFAGRVYAEPTREGFRANSRPGAAWQLIGGLEGVLGPIFMPYLFPGGVVLGWNSALPADGKPGEGWLGPGGMHRYGVRTLMDSPDGPVRLLLPDGRAVAIMTLAPSSGGTGHDDYSLVADRIDRAMRTRLFVQPVNGKSAPPSGLDAYLSGVHDASRLAQDDVEFAFGVAMAARGNLKFFPLPLRRIDPDADLLLQSWPEKDLTTVQWSIDTESRIGTIKVEVFLATADVDHAMEQLLAESPHGIVIDLRGCQGIELSALRMAAWLVPSTVDGGTFHGLAGPDGARELHAGGAAEFDGAGATLDQAGAIHISVEPVEHPFAGPVAILTNRRTAGTAEALVSILKSTGRAKTVGEPTAGRVILSRPVDVGQGWILRMPAAGWLPPGGASPVTKGIEPDIRAGSEAAPTRAGEALTGPDADP